MLNADALLTPEGRLDRPTLWPRVSEGEVLDLLDGFIADAYRQAGMEELPPGRERDEVAAEWAYYRAYDHVYDRLLINPSSVALDGQGSASWLLTQIQDVQAKAGEALDRFADLMSIALPEEPDTPITRDSACVPTAISFAHGPLVGQGFDPEPNP